MRDTIELDTIGYIDDKLQIKSNDTQLGIDTLGSILE